jgi:uncharacterized membrane protein YgcG
VQDCHVCGRRFDPLGFQVVVPELGRGFDRVECAQSARALASPGSRIAATPLAAIGRPAALAAAAAPVPIFRALSSPAATAGLLTVGTVAAAFLWMRVLGTDSVGFPFQRESAPRAVAGATVRVEPPGGPSGEQAGNPVVGLGVSPTGSPTVSSAAPGDGPSSLPGPGEQPSGPTPGPGPGGSPSEPSPGPDGPPSEPSPGADPGGSPGGSGPQPSRGGNGEDGGENGDGGNGNGAKHDKDKKGNGEGGKGKGHIKHGDTIDEHSPGHGGGKKHGEGGSESHGGKSSGGDKKHGGDKSHEGSHGNKGSNGHGGAKHQNPGRNSDKDNGHKGQGGGKKH